MRIEQSAAARDGWRIEIAADHTLSRAQNNALARWHFQGAKGAYRAWLDDNETMRACLNACKRVGLHGRAVRLKPDRHKYAPEPYQPSAAARIHSLNENKGSCARVPPKPYARYIAT